MPTTSGDVYVANLDGQIQAMQRQFDRRPNETLRLRLARTLYNRFQIRGRLADLERARDLLADGYQQQHQVALVLLYADVLAAFHEFRQARQMIDKARASAPQHSGLIEMRDRLDVVTGQHDAVATLQSDALGSLAARVVELVDTGRPAAASRLLQQAQKDYRGTSPFPLAWLHLQQGVVFLRYGDNQSAAEFFAAAVERLPQYTAAIEHLAEAQLLMGEYASAAALYRVAIEHSDNPLFPYQLSHCERGLGDTEQADRLQQRAETGYAAALQQYPLLYADHGARFYLETGNPHRALRIAEMNFGNRQHLSAALLLLEARHAAGETAAACEQFSTLLQQNTRAPEFLSLAPDLEQGCRKVAPAGDL